MNYFDLIKLIKKILLPFQNMVRADLFSGSLAVWNLRRSRSDYSPLTVRAALCAASKLRSSYL